jgi:D-glycero-D-manno-heptose 1,7-bisphosphate phosphatase
MAIAFFLDRDGVIIENRPDYVRRWSDVSIFAQALETLRILKTTAYKVILITNQAGIGKGLIAPQTAKEINQRLVTEIGAHGGRVDGIYVCPHTAEAQCACRKPKPGLIFQAASDFGIDLNASILIGDALTDIQAGQAAGVGRLCLVKTGRGSDEMPRVEAALPPSAVAVYENFYAAVQDLLQAQASTPTL